MGTTSERDACAIEALKKNVLGELQSYDLDGDNMISKAELEHVLFDETAQEMFDAFGIDLTYLLNILDMIYDDTLEVPIDTIMTLMLAVRTDLPPTIRNISEMQAYVKWFITLALEEHETRLLKSMEELVLSTEYAL